MLIEGQLYSKANSRMLIRKGNRTISVKSVKAQKSFADMVLQLRAQWRGQKPIPEPAELICYVYYGSRRPDLDISLLMDALQAAGVVENDRHIFRIHATKIIDPIFPRIEVTVRPMQEEITG